MKDCASSHNACLLAEPAAHRDSLFPRGLAWCLALFLSASAAPAQTVNGQPGLPTLKATVNFTELAQREAAAAAPARAEGTVAPEPMPGPGARPLPAGLTGHEAAPAPVPPATEELSPAPSSSFLGLNDNGTSIPPDTHGAAGPNHLMVTLNTQVRILSRTGTVISTVSLNAFWSSLGNPNVFDPKVLYDPYANRWIFTACANGKSATSAVLIASSQTNDPTGNWNLFTIDADSTNALWADYPSFGFNRNWVVVTMNMFQVAGSGGFTRSNIYVFSKTALYAGSSAPFTLLTSSDGFTMCPAITYDNSINTMYLLGAWNSNSGGNGFLRLSTVTGAVGSEVLNASVAFPVTANPWNGTGSTGFADFAPQLGSTQKVMTNDDRIQNVVYRNGSLWTTQTAFLPAGTGSRSAVQWWQISTTGTTQQFGRVDSPSGGKFYAFPSISVNAASDVLLGYSRYGADQHVSGNYSFRASTDPANTMQSEVVLKAGEASYYKTFSGTRNRWGDYSATMVDPVNDTDFWTLQEYAATASGGSDRWGVWWGLVPAGVAGVPSLSINDVSVAEGNSGTTSATFTVSLSATSAQTVTVNYATANGTAIASGDYAAVSNSLTFTPGQTSKSITIAVNGDTANEGDETFTVTLSSPSNATLADASGTGTIQNDDGGSTGSTFLNATPIVIPASATGVAPYPSTINVSGVTGTVTKVTATFNGVTHTFPQDVDVLLVGPAGQTAVLMSDVGGGTDASGLTLTFDDTAAASLDANALASGTFKPSNRDDGEGGDDYPSPAPTGPYGATLSVFQGATANGAWQLFVNDDFPGADGGQFASGWSITITSDSVTPPPSISVSDASVVEGNSGTADATFTVTLSAASAQTVTVNYATADGTAVQPGDYTQGSGTVSFSPGQTSKTFAVAVKGDAINEPNENFLVNLSAPVNGTIGDGQGVGVISNDDSVPAISINDVAVQEGASGTSQAVFAVTLSAGSAQAVTVHFATANGTAQAGSDYTATSGDVSFAPGVTSQSVSVLVSGDLVTEPNETFVVNLTTPANATIADSQGTGTITNDDSQPALSVNDVSVVEGAAGTTSATFTVSLSSASSQTVTANWVTSNGTATAPTDYASGSSSVSFPPGSLTQTFSVTVNGDLDDETDETFNVTLSGATNAGIGDAQGVGTIIDDDGAGGGNTFSNSMAITIPTTAGAATPYPSAINVVGVVGNISRVTVTLHGLSHTFGQDLDVLLVGPQGQTLVLMSDCGGGQAADGVTLAFDDAASVSLSSAALATGTAKPTNLADSQGTDDYPAPAPAPAPSYGTTLSVFNGTNANGQWQLFVSDDFAQDGGSIAGGWSLTISTGATGPELSINDVTIAEGNAGTTNATFNVTLSPASAQTVTVQYATSNGTASEPDDYVAQSGTLTFTPGMTSQPLSVPVNGDTAPEATETFAVTLSAPANANVADATGVGTIQNDDSASSTATFTNNSGITIPSSGTATPYPSTLEVTGLTGSITKITATLTNLTHTFPDDIDALLVGPGGQTVMLMSDAGGESDLSNVTLIFDDDSITGLPDADPIVSRTTLPTNFGGDDVLQAPAPAGPHGNNLTAFNGTAPNGTWQLFVFDDAGGDVGTIASWSLTISTTDTGGLPTLAITDATVTEGNGGSVSATFNVSLSAASAQTVTVQYATVDGSASAGTDYEAQAGQLEFLPGVTTGTIVVPVNGDLFDEPDELFGVNLTGPVNAAISDSLGVGTIQDDDVPPEPVNNDFANAISLSGAIFSITTSNAGADRELDEPLHAGFTGGFSIWFEWTAPISGQVIIDTAGSDFDTLLAVYTGNSLPTLKKVAANDDFGGFTSRVAFKALAGQSYFIAVDGFSGSGTINLNLTQFAAFQGSYQGLVTDDNTGYGIGFFNVKVGAKGTFSGKLKYQNETFSVKGALDASGSYRGEITRRNGSPLQFFLLLDTTEGAQQMFGFIFDIGTSASFTVNRSIFSTRTNPFPDAAKYTFAIFSDPATDFTVPKGHGFGTIIVAPNGNLRLAGRLGDGVTLSYSTVVSQFGEAAIFAQLYKTGSLAGLLTFRNVNNSDLDGTLRWIKPPTKGPILPQAFETDVVVSGSAYAKPAPLSRVLPDFELDGGQGVVTLDFGNLAGVVTTNIELNSKNKILVLVSQPEDLKLTINLGRGLFTGSFNTLFGKRKVSGALHQKRSKAFGQFSGLDETGTITLEAAP